ncbi:hypothetical protein A3K64_02970 [Candidatus Micrarchaeota archaeon RBG_16_36_9]|nr:MAG: hypothetical protein A3K64_02970 [Candidatus Micrarchaeota archaeon RBG_16_36_9]
MKKILYLIILTIILSSSVLADNINVLNISSGTVVTGITYLKVNLVNQDPSSANPGEYVKLLFKIENRGTVDAQNVTLTLVPEYPFSLDPGTSAVNNIGTVNGMQTGSKAFLVEYKVKVDKDAVDGDNEIKLKYSENDKNYYTQTFNVTVSNSKTDFDIIAQDSTTLAIANTGNNTASAVIIRIPQQQNFIVNGSSATIIGNLNAGDYTLATFQINPIITNNSGMTNILTVEISYTDILGIRRTVQKSLPFEFGSSELGNITGKFTQRGGTILSNGLLYIVIGVVGIVIVVVFIRFRTRKKK